MICVRQYRLGNNKGIKRAWSEIRNTLADNGWTFGEIQLHTKDGIKSCTSADEAESLMNFGDCSEVCIKKISWQDFTLPESHIEEKYGSPESILIGGWYILFRIVRVDEQKSDRQIADILCSALQMKCDGESSVVLLSEAEKNHTGYFPVRDLPFLKNEMVKASDYNNGKIPYTCRLAPIFKQMDIPDSFTVSGGGNTVFLQSENYKGNNFRLVFSCDRNSSVIADGIRLESPILCTAAYNTAYSRFHMVLWGREAMSRDELKEHIAQCINRGARVVDWLEAHVDEMVELPVPSWFDL